MKKPRYLKKRYSGFCPEYLAFAKKKLGKPLTNNQVRFASWLLTNKQALKNLMILGDMETVFRNVTTYKKFSNK